MRVPHRALRAQRSDRANAYHGTGGPGAVARRLFLAAVLAPTVAAGGCSMSMELGSLFSDKKEESTDAGKGNPRDVTGSLPTQSTRSRSADGGMSTTDWSFATAALREAMQDKGSDTSIPWQNPSTGVRGTVTPVSSAFVADGFACRNFLASHVGNGREGWFEGTACRVQRGQWDVRTARPLQKP